MAKFSFFLPAYKAKFLDDTIKSIISQSYADWELVIVNDCSPEDIERIIAPYQEDSRVKYFENPENKGGHDLVSFWNSFIPICEGEFIIFASDDDVYEASFLFEMRYLSDKYPNCNLLHCRTRFIDEYGQVIQMVQPSLEYESQIDFIYQKLIWGRKLTLQEYCFKRKVLEENGGIINFPLAWYSDNATTFTMASGGVAYSSKCLFNFRLSNINISGQEKKCFQKTEAMKRYVKWLGIFLPNIVCKSVDEDFMKVRMLSLYKGIVFSHYHIYLPYLRTNEFLKEIRYIRKKHLFANKTQFSMIVRHFFSKK